MDLNKALEEHSKVMKELSKEMADFRREIASKPTRLDFLSSCMTINRLLDERHCPPLSETILEQWGVTGGESMPELRAIVDEWLDHIRSKYEV